MQSVCFYNESVSYLAPYIKQGKTHSFVDLLNKEKIYRIDVIWNGRGKAYD